MKKPSSDAIAGAIFVISFALVAMVYGIVSSWWGWFPAPQIGAAHRNFLELKNNWRNDIALEPTRHLIAPGGRDTGPERGFSGSVPPAVAEGYVLVSGLNDDQEQSFHVVRMFDGNGTEVHRWPVHYELFDDQARPQNVMLHGMEVFEDGSLVAAFDSGFAIARFDACGEPMWVNNGAYHHSIARDGEGRLVTWLDNAVAWLDEDTGEVLKTVDIETDMIPAAGGEAMSLFRMRTRMPELPTGKISYLDDPWHPNDAEPLRAEMADAFPMFEAGDVLISLRELNLVAVLDPDTARMKWMRQGPWFKQHDPDWEADGTISVFDNATGEGRSRILRVRPGEEGVEEVFAGSDAVPFYSWRRGKHQTLPDGGILLTEAEGGRVLEVTPGGEVAWERHMVWDEDENLATTEARWVPGDFFAGGLPDCGGGQMQVEAGAEDATEEM